MAPRCSRICLLVILAALGIPGSWAVRQAGPSQDTDSVLGQAASNTTSSTAGSPPDAEPAPAAPTASALEASRTNVSAAEIRTGLAGGCPTDPAKLAERCKEAGAGTSTSGFWSGVLEWSGLDCCFRRGGGEEDAALVPERPPSTGSPADQVLQYFENNFCAMVNMAAKQDVTSQPAPGIAEASRIFQSLQDCCVPNAPDKCVEDVDSEADVQGVVQKLVKAVTDKLRSTPSIPLVLQALLAKAHHLLRGSSLMDASADAQHRVALALETSILMTVFFLLFIQGFAIIGAWMLAPSYGGHRRH